MLHRAAHCDPALRRLEAGAGGGGKWSEVGAEWRRADGIGGGVGAEGGKGEEGKRDPRVSG